MIPIKICGITNLADAKCAEDHGASAIGFIFYDNSPRAISIDKVKSIANHTQNHMAKVGVFVNHDKSFIDDAIQSIPLDLIQLHGDESPEFCNQISVPVIKALRIKNEASMAAMDNYKVDAFLLDTFSKDAYGGTGETFNWSFLKRKSDTPIILSGGLNPNNIMDAIESVNPAAVDVNSGIEKSPGIKDHNKMKTLFTKLKETCSSINVFTDSLTLKRMNT